jgi:hypothetical protein
MRVWSSVYGCATARRSTPSAWSHEWSTPKAWRIPPRHPVVRQTDIDGRRATAPGVEGPVIPAGPAVARITRGPARALLLPKGRTYRIAKVPCGSRVLFAMHDVLRDRTRSDGLDLNLLPQTSSSPCSRKSQRRGAGVTFHYAPQRPGNPVSGRGRVGRRQRPCSPTLLERTRNLPATRPSGTEGCPPTFDVGSPPLVPPLPRNPAYVPPTNGDKPEPFSYGSLPCTCWSQYAPSQRDHRQNTGRSVAPLPALR